MPFFGSANMFALDFPIANEFIEEPLYKKKAHLAGAFFFGTGWTRVELATSDVTGRCSNQIELPPQIPNYGQYRIRTDDPLRVKQLL